MIFENKTYEELIDIENKLNKEYKEIEKQSLLDGLSYEQFCDKAHDVKQNLFFIAKYKRKIQTPSLVFDKKWNGDTYSFDTFKNKCYSEELTDLDGYGYYATNVAKSDVIIKPSDIIENIYRTDFTHVIWFNYA